MHTASKPAGVECLSHKMTFKKIVRNLLITPIREYVVALNMPRQVHPVYLLSEGNSERERDNKAKTENDTYPINVPTIQEKIKTHVGKNGKVNTEDRFLNRFPS
jgi:hypothetical protein